MGLGATQRPRLAVLTPSKTHLQMPSLSETRGWDFNMGILEDTVQPVTLCRLAPKPHVLLTCKTCSLHPSSPSGSGLPPAPTLQSRVSSKSDVTRGRFVLRQVAFQLRMCETRWGCASRIQWWARNWTDFPPCKGRNRKEGGVSGP